ncbi:MAG TPA: glutathionylspermidine synthase family protein [Rhizomicrobium sp.]|nr:glutathionylspermidine synthase family protein [Rhizomicrobium sp.]
MHAKFDAVFPGAMGEFDFLDPVELPAVEIGRILSAARAVERIYRRAGEVLRQGGDAMLSRLGLPSYLRDLAPLQAPADAALSLGRVDLVRGPRSYKVLEYNTDGPGFLTSAFALTGFLCGELAMTVPRPNRFETLASGVRNALAGIPGDARIVFGYGEDDPGNRRAAECLRAAAGPRNSSCRIVETLRFAADGVFDAEGHPVAALWHVSHWAQFLIETNKSDPLASIPVLKSLVDAGRLRIIGAAHTGLLQSKAVQALIWEWYAQERHFSPRERALIAQYMLPTHFDPIPGAARQVVKPVLGVTGDSIRVVDGDLNTLVHGTGAEYRDQLHVYQEYVDLPKSRLLTERGWKDLNVAATCFIVGGRACGILMRAGLGITDADWWVLPIAQSG